jgi:hypothetical protein
MDFKIWFFGELKIHPSAGSKIWILVNFIICLSVNQEIRPSMKFKTWLSETLEIHLKDLQKGLFRKLNFFVFHQTQKLFSIVELQNALRQTTKVIFSELKFLSFSELKNYSPSPNIKCALVALKMHFNKL